MGSKSIQIRVLLKNRRDLRKIGDIFIGEKNSDIYYKPSTGRYLTKELRTETIEHFSFHKSGNIVLKSDEGIHKPIRKGLPIKDIGYQKFLSDLILEPKKLSFQKKAVRTHDVVFNTSNYEGQVVFILSMISGKQIVKKYRGEPTQVKFTSLKDNKEVLGLETRGIGPVSDNADKALQFLLVKIKVDPMKLKTKRCIKVYPDQNVKND